MRISNKAKTFSVNSFDLSFPKYVSLFGLTDIFKRIITSSDNCFLILL